MSSEEKRFDYIPLIGSDLKAFVQDIIIFILLSYTSQLNDFHIIISNLDNSYWWMGALLSTFWIAAVLESF